MPNKRKKLPARVKSLDEPEHLRPASLVKRWDGAVTLGTLKNWRSQGRGPPWLKLERQVVYPVKHLVEWEQDNMRPKVPF